MKIIKDIIGGTLSGILFLFLMLLLVLMSSCGMQKPMYKLNTEPKKDLPHEWCIMSVREYSWFGGEWQRANPKHIHKNCISNKKAKELMEEYRIIEEARKREEERKNIK